MYITKIQEFKDYIKNTPESDKKQQHLRELDTQLAELIILNNDCYIQLNNELILDSNSNYKTDDDLRKEALRAIKGLRELEMETEYIQYIEKFKPMFVFDDEFSKEINNNIKALEMKQKNAKLSNRETEMLTVYRDLQGNNITKEKVADAIKHYEDRVQAYNKDEISKEAGVTAVECLDICRRAQKHLNKDEKIHYIVKLVSKEEEPEEEKPEEIKEEEPEEIKETEQEEEPEEIKEEEQEEEPEEIKEEEPEEPEEIKEEEQEEPEEIKEEDDEISAVLSDVTASYEDMISREVENELTDERNNLSRAHPKKFIRFFNR
ncbi:MAG: hypothetical protein LBH96_04480 [Candidatus Peribacteria bacterium]|jgi:hypothetical protein|nr:hypothetical protein [Candidatus Peribacteria bacterium]